MTDTPPTEQASADAMIIMDKVIEALKADTDCRGRGKFDAAQIIQQYGDQREAMVGDAQYDLGVAEGFRRGVEAAAKECAPRPDEAWSRDSIRAAEWVQAHILALLETEAG